MKVYFYNGFKPPYEIDLSETTITSNYLGDMTDFITMVLEDYSPEDLVTDQPLCNIGVWFDPKLEDLQEFNISVMLEKGTYLENFK